MIFPDHDLALLREEVPHRFWHNHTFEEWPNVHSWVRWKRFGEHPDVMRARHAAVVNGTPWPYRAAA
jgi:hypothetical protein